VPRNFGRVAASLARFVARVCPVGKGSEAEVIRCVAHGCGAGVVVGERVACVAPGGSVAWRGCWAVGSLGVGDTVRG
jgi:hypothetical protein